MGFLYLFMGVIISSAVIPACLTLLWSGMNKQAAMYSPPLGLCFSLIAWLVTTNKESGGVLTVDTLGANYPMLAGNVVALLSPAIFIPIFTLIFGIDKYDWISMKEIRKANDHDLADAAGIDLEMVPGEMGQSENNMAEEQAKLLKASKIAKGLTGFLTLALLILWPFPMYLFTHFLSVHSHTNIYRRFGSRYIFSKSFFTGWVVVGIIWIFCALAGVGIYPLWEGRKSVYNTFRAIFLDITGKKHPGSYSNNVEIVGASSEKSDGGEAKKNLGSD